MLLLENVRVWELDRLLACLDFDLTFAGGCLGTLVEAMSLACLGWAVLAAMCSRRWAHRSFDFFLSAWLLFTDFDLVRRFSGFFGAVEVWLTTGLGVSFPFRGTSLLPLR